METHTYIDTNSLFDATETSSRSYSVEILVKKRPVEYQEVTFSSFLNLIPPKVIDAQ